MTPPRCLYYSLTLTEPALLLAFTHLGLSLYLDGQSADGKHRAAPQSYVSTASVILANGFGLSLNASLAVAFTQYLWYILRTSTLKVATIDSFFGLRANILMLFDRLVIAKGPILVAIALLIWAIQIVVSFPPGSLTVRSTTMTLDQTMKIPTFNASFVCTTSLLPVDSNDSD